LSKELISTENILQEMLEPTQLLMVINLVNKVFLNLYKEEMGSNKHLP